MAKEEQIRSARRAAEELLATKLHTASDEQLDRIAKELGIGAEPDRFAEMPKDGTQFWFINLSGEIISAVWQDCQVYSNYWQRGNCFPTREGAEHSLKAGKYAEDIAWETIKRTAAKYPQPTAEDWANITKRKYFPALDNRGGSSITVEWTEVVRWSPLPHFYHAKDARAFAAECEAEIKLVMGVQS